MEEKTEMPGRSRRHTAGSGRRNLLPLLVALVVVAAAGVGGFFWWRSRQVMDTTTKYWFDKAAQDGTLEGKTPQEIQGILDTIVEEGMFNVSVNARVVFENGKAKGSLGLENISANRYYCRASLQRDDGGKVIYKSEGLKPGQYIDEIELTENLAAGTYPCTLRMIATDPETLQDIGQVDVKVEVIVLN